MSSRTARLALFLLLLTSIGLRSPQLLLLAVLLLLIAAASALWGRYCLAGVSYARRFETARVFCGEQLDLWIEIVNAKPLPLAWLKAEDEFPAEFAVAGTELGKASGPQRRTLVNLVSVRWYERIRRRYRLTALQRGLYDFGPAQLSSGDIFGFRTRFRALPAQQTVLVYPRIIPLEHLDLRLARPGGESLASRRLVEDPLRLAGVRDYRPGDPVRHIHWKGTARQGRLQTKVFEPGASQCLYLCLNGQTLERAYEGILADHFETAILVATALAHAALEARHPVGLTTNNGVVNASGRVRLPATRHASQLTRVLETLAQLTHFTLMPFDQVLRLEAHSLPFGATVIAISSVVTEAVQAALLALLDGGHPVALIIVADDHRRPLISLPPAVPIYYVAPRWTDLHALKLD